VTRYYPITINKKQANTTITGGEGTDKGSIVANTRYVLTAVIKGEGVDDDSKEIDPATLKLTVTVADWALTINKCDFCDFSITNNYKQFVPAYRVSNISHLSASFYSSLLLFGVRDMKVCPV
jgi:hypothetical protein